MFPHERNMNIICCQKGERHLKHLFDRCLNVKLEILSSKEKEKKSLKGGNCLGSENEVIKRKT